MKQNRGNKFGRKCSLSDEDIRMVRVMFVYRWSRADIARKMGINYWSVCNILGGKYYVGRGEI